MTEEQKNQLSDREQFRRYAEAALGGLIGNATGCSNLAGVVFRAAQEMMLAETASFERYQLEATQIAIDEERKRQGVEPPYTDPS